MRTRRELLRAVLGFSLGAGVTACIIQTQPEPLGTPPPPPAARAAAPSGNAPAQDYRPVANGEYACSFTQDGYSYPDFACVIYTRRDGQQVLEKVSGSQRIHGALTPDDDGFGFQGTFYCPFGDCTEEVSARFTATAPGQFEGTLFKSQGSAQTLVRLRHLPAGFGRGGYGGVAYGGVTYGGASYGGTSYGGVRQRDALDIGF